MIIVAGWLRTDPADRDRYLAACRPVVQAARATPGCTDFHLSADPLDPGRINVFEQWDDEQSVDDFRHRDDGPSLPEVVLAANVRQHRIASTTTLN